MTNELLKPRELTPASFCKLATDTAATRGIQKIQDAARTLGISPTRWSQIRLSRMPDFSTMTRREKLGWVGSITRICTGLELDTRTSLEALGLPFDESAIANAHQSAVGDIELGEPELNVLLELIRLIGKPVPLSFAAKFLIMRRTQVT